MVVHGLSPKGFAMLGARLLKHPGTPFTITYRETATFPLGKAHYGI
jgi:hypothetical protein